MGGFNQGAGTLASAFVRAPIMRQQALLLQARQAEQAEMAREADARTGLLKTQTQGLIDQQIDDGNFKKALKLWMANPNDTGVQGDVISQMGEAYKKNPEGTAKGIGSLLATIQARNGSTNYANMGALQGSAASIANNQADNAEKAARPVDVANGGTLMSPTGNIIGSGAFTLSPGQERFAASGPASTVDPTTAAEDDQAPNLDAAPVASVPAKTPPENLGALATVYNRGLMQSTGGTNTTEAASTLQAFRNAVQPASANPPTVGLATPVSRGGIATVNSQEDYDALPAGARYQDSQGNVGVKKGK